MRIGVAMLSDIFNPRRRAARREFEIAIHYLLHDAEKLIPLLKDTYKEKWSGFTDDILNGSRPYEEATAVVGVFLQQSFRNQDRPQREAVIVAVANNNLATPPNFLRIIGQVSHFLWVAEKDGEVRENLWTIWLDDLSKTLIETGELTQEQCIYLVALASQYRDAKRKAVSATS
jgi:hypothetical protein